MPILFVIFINDLPESLSKLYMKMRMKSVFDRFKLQKDLNGLAIGKQSLVIRNVIFLFRPTLYNIQLCPRWT